MPAASAPVWAVSASHVVGSDLASGASRPARWSAARATTTAPAPMRTTSTPRAVRRTPSTAQPAACPRAVAARTQASTTSWAPTRCPGGVTSAVTARRVHACTIQARLTGASRSAPRCSVTGLIGWTAASLRDSSSRPPPLPMAAPTARSRKPAKAAPRLVSRAASARSTGAEPAGPQVDPRGRHGEERGQHDHDGQAEEGGAATAYGPRAERHQVAGVAHRLQPGVRPGVSRGGHGRPRR